MNYQKDSEPAGEQMTLFSQAGSLDPVNHTAQQESEKAKMMTVTSGRKCLEQFGKFNRATLWAKTFAGLLIGMEGWYSTRCKLTWKLKATKCSRFYFQLQVSTLPTGGTESGLLPTPTASIGGPEPEGKTGRKLITAVSQLLPTVTTDSVSMRKAKYKQGGMPLTTFVLSGLLPTPQAAEGYKLTGKESQDSLTKRIGNSSQLNPLFVTEMMGFPVDWLTLPFQDGEGKA